MHISLMSVIGESIRKYRKARGLTQTELAETLGTSQYVLTNYERGVNNPPAIKMPEIAKALDVTLEQLYGLQSEDSKVETRSSDKRREIQLQKVFGDLPPADQRALLKQAKALRAQKHSSNKKAA